MKLLSFVGHLSALDTYPA